MQLVGQQASRSASRSVEFEIKSLGSTSYQQYCPLQPYHLLPPSILPPASRLNVKLIVLILPPTSRSAILPLSSRTTSCFLPYYFLAEGRLAGQPIPAFFQRVHGGEPGLPPGRSDAKSIVMISARFSGQLAVWPIKCRFRRRSFSRPPFSLVRPFSRQKTHKP